MFCESFWFNVHLKYALFALKEWFFSSADLEVNGLGAD